MEQQPGPFLRCGVHSASGCCVSDLIDHRP